MNKENLKIFKRYIWEFNQFGVKDTTIIEVISISQKFTTYRFVWGDIVSKTRNRMRTEVFKARFKPYNQTQT